MVNFTEFRPFCIRYWSVSRGEICLNCIAGIGLFNLSSSRPFSFWLCFGYLSPLNVSWKEIDPFIIISLNHTVQKRLNIESSWNRFACEVSSAVLQPRFSQVTIISTFYSVYQIHDRCALRIKKNNITAVFYFFLFLFYMRFKENPLPDSWIPR